MYLIDKFIALFPRIRRPPLRGLRKERYFLLRQIARTDAFLDKQKNKIINRKCLCCLNLDICRYYVQLLNKQIRRCERLNYINNKLAKQAALEIYDKTLL